MSHFTVLVIGNDPEGQLEPYYEDKEVEPYERDCSCAKWKAKSIVTARIEKEYKSFQQLRDDYHSMPAEKQTTDAWKKHIAKYLELEEKYLKEIIAKTKSDPKCPDCKGKGKYMTTYNPDSKWDWYQMGGRWSGFFKLTPNAKAKRKAFEAKRLKATKLASAHIGVKPFLLGALIGEGKIVDKIFDVDQCKKGDVDWKGMVEGNKQRSIDLFNEMKAKAMNEDKEVSPSNLEFIYGIKPDQTVEEFAEEEAKVFTFAVVKDGKWYQKGDMGWWGMTSNEKDDDKWIKEWNKLVMSLPPDTLLTMYDCHI